MTQSLDLAPTVDPTPALDWLRVASQCDGLSDAKLTQLVTLIELLPPTERPQQVLDAIRPRLAALRPRRRLTVQRLLFQPVEDLFDPPGRYRRGSGRLGRHSVAACWTALRPRLDPNLMDDLSNRIRTVTPEDDSALMALGRRLWPAAAAGLRAVLAQAAAEPRESLRLFGRDEDVVQQLAIIAAILEIAPDLMALRVSLPPRPIDLLTEADLQRIGDGLGRLRDPDQTKVFLLALAARMTRPGLLLDLLAEMPFPGSGSDRDRLARELATGMVDSLVRESSTLQGRTDPPADPRLAAAQARRLVNGLNSLRATLEGRFGGHAAVAPALDQVRGARRDIGRFVLNAVVAQAEPSLLTLAALPWPETSPADRCERQIEAESMALALHHCTRMADGLGIGSEVGARVTTLCRELEHRARTDRQTGGDGGIGTVRLIELLAGPDHAERTLRAVGAG